MTTSAEKMAPKISEQTSIQKWAQAFQNPPVEYRPMPFVVLNDEYEAQRGEKQLTRLLESLAGAGYGGAYLHPRPGLITEYLSPRWFELIRHCIEECKRLGMVPHLYDENSYPSGFAGGHVPALVPEARSRSVYPLRGQGSETLPMVFLSLHRWEGDRPGSALFKSEITFDTEWVAFILQDLASMPWHGETIYPSLLDPRTAEAFLETTYEAYRRELGSLWKDIGSIFTDEPHLPGTGHGPWSMGLHLTPYVIGQFQQRLGYDLVPHVAELFFSVGDFRKTRYDFYNLCHILWMENWALPLERWCHTHKIKLTGHYLEHDWPCPYATPGHVHLLAHMDWPGTDMLTTFLLRGHSYTDLQGFAPALPGCEPHGLFYLRQVHSIANQLGKERVMDESWGAGGSESAPEDWMRIGRWLIIHGVNHLVPHSSWDTIRGGRKTDHPQNFAPQSRWFDYLRPLNDELGRLCWISNQGESINRILILDSLTSAFSVARKGDCFDPESVEAMRNVSLGSDLTSTVKSILPIKKAANEFAQSLADVQIDYDLGDEYVLEEFGTVSESGLLIGRRTYPLVILMPEMDHLRAATVARLREYLKQGGRLLSLPLKEFFIDGVKSDALAALKSEFPTQFEFLENCEMLQHRAAALYPPRLSFSGHIPVTGIAHMHRITENGEVFIIVNSSPETLKGEATLKTSLADVVSLNPTTGETHLLKSIRAGESLRVPIEIFAGGAAVLIASGEVREDASENTSDSEIAPERNGHKKTSIDLELIHASRREDNMLAIDFCSVEINGKEFPPENVVAANHRYWKAHGMETYGWNMVIQYRDQVLARDRGMRPDSGGTVRYKFEITPRTALENIRLVVECPEVWRVAINGEQLKFELENTFRDPRFHWTSLAGKIQHGINEVTLTGKPFSVRQEIDQIYLLGNFACEPISPGFRLVPSRPITWGSWKAQGLPFYDGEISYTLKMPENAKELTFNRENWGGALIVALQNGGEIGRVTEAPWKLKLPSLTSREIEVRVVGLPKNLFGPWHDPDHPWGVASPQMWTGPQIPTAPQPGVGYGHLDLGFFRAPITTD